MQLTIATAAALALVYARSAFAVMGIDTPSTLVQCQPSLLAWHEGAPPYYLSVIPGGQPGATPLKSFDAVNDLSRTWVVDIASGTVVTIVLKDSSGAIAYSDKVPIQGSQDNSCIIPAAAPAPAPASATAAAPAPPANGASVSPASPAPASQPPAAPAVSPPAGQAPPPPASRPTGSQAAVASSSAKPSSGANRASVVNGFAGLLAILGVALF
ncbi:hypothetical protein AGABI2DRAFT_191358 [Agaricus bisporus var. bisporus H97]|uniref:hypothetical protein n=1 Tax=Agaricus bisporus var. bisporus (strain H97 / ATCC MYA-4626 / FGSC 10389) TaxID=936046 RepID=UPI00029F6D2A|nr:hypothetical protein AGABI2DRAFT_191358 [Agaricus bisporus var. bisporus H97]EKV49287.1 hypothetical protein AGABI2DRAFT_191358 [Agaricus bisporus var. bisporus H97]